MLEGISLVLDLRSFLRNQANFGIRPVVVIDNQGLIGAIENGRLRLGFQTICRQIAVLVVAGGIQ